MKAPFVASNIVKRMNKNCMTGVSVIEVSNCRFERWEIRFQD